MNTENQWPEMDTQKATFIVERCETFVNRTILDRDVIQNKANLLLGLIVTVATILANALLNPKSPLQDNLQNFILAQIILLLICAIALVCKCLAPNFYAAPSASPRQLLKPDFANQQTPWLLIGYTHLLQKSIDYNTAANHQLTRNLRNIALAVFLSPALAHLISLLLD